MFENDSSIIIKEINKMNIDFRSNNITNAVNTPDISVKFNK